VVALLVGGIGLILVVTDRMVRGIYAGLGTAQPVDPADPDQR
jgi:hypothetical protein